MTLVTIRPQQASTNVAKLGSHRGIQGFYRDKQMEATV